MDKEHESLSFDYYSAETDSNDVVISTTSAGQWFSRFDCKDLPAKFSADHRLMMILSGGAKPLDYFDVFPETLFRLSEPLYIISQATGTKSGDSNSVTDSSWT